jgi:hypothetical protein
MYLSPDILFHSSRDKAIEGIKCMDNTTSLTGTPLRYHGYFTPVDVLMVEFPAQSF